MGVGARVSSPSEVMKKFRFPKYTCVPGTQLTLRLAIHGLMKVTKRAKAPIWRTNCQRFVLPMSEFVLHIWPRWCAKRTQGCMLIRAEYSYVQSLLLLVLLALRFAVGVTNEQERKEVPSLW
jgi:hypothetical protein